jgi:hypothetical protein
MYPFAKWSYTVHLVFHSRAVLVFTILDIELNKDEFEKGDLVDIGFFFLFLEMKNLA